MLEADNQLILDEYMSRAISYDRFEAEAFVRILLLFLKTPSICSEE